MSQRTQPLLNHTGTSATVPCLRKRLTSQKPNERAAIRRGDGFTDWHFSLPGAGFYLPMYLQQCTSS